MTHTPLDNVVGRLGGARRNGSGWSARCPAHDDGRASLSVSEGNDGRVLIHCHAGCELDTILAALKLGMADLHPHKPNDLRNNGGVPPQIVATYDYRRGGDLIAQKVRYFPKDFRLRRPDANERGGWAWNLRGVDPPLYNEGQVRNAVFEGLPVWIVEGEKDADAITDRGEVATTNIGGADKWRDTDAGMFRGADRVVIVADRDEAGYRHARRVRDSIAPHCPNVEVVESDRGKDAAEHFDRDGTFEDFRPVRWPQVDPEPEPDDEPPPLDVEGIGSTTADTVKPTRVQWLWPGYIPLAKLTMLDGDPGVAKSTVALDLAARVTTGSPMPHQRAEDRNQPAGVVFLGAEDGLSDTVVPRLLAAGADLSRVELFTHVLDRNEDGRPVKRPPELPTDIPRLAHLIRLRKANLVILDVLTAFFAGWVNTWRDSDVRRALVHLSDLADETGASILAIRHLSKGSAGGPAIYRGGGSVAIGGAARAVLMAAHDPSDDDGQRRILAVAKSNLAKTATSLCYEIRADAMWDTGRIEWGQTSPLTANDLGFKPRGSGDARTDESADWLSAVLADGPMSFADLRTLALHEGIKERDLRRAGQTLGVLIDREGKGRDHRSIWRLPPP